MMEPDDAKIPPSEEEDSKTNATSAPPEMNNATPPSLGKLMTLARPEWTLLAVAVFLMIGSEATGLYNPILLADAYDYLVNPTLDTASRQSEINQVMTSVLVIHTAGVLGAWLRSTIMAIAGERVVARLRVRLYRQILKQEIGFFDQHKSGELVSRLSSDTTLLQQATSSALPETFLGMTKLLVAMGLMFWLSPPLAGVAIGFVVLVFVMCAPFGKYIGELSKQYQDILGQAQTHSTEALGAMRTVQSFAAEEREGSRYQTVIGAPNKWWIPARSDQTTYAVGARRGIATSAFFTIIFGVGFGSMYITLWYGFKLINDGKMTLGELTAFQSYIFQIGGSLGQTGRFVSQLLEAKGASGRIFYLLEREPEIPSTPPSKPRDNDEESPIPTRKLDNLQGAVAFNHVSFHYPSRPDVTVLREFSLEIPPNTTAALVGSSGAGKSTVVALLQRFYDVAEGSVTIDGVDIREMDLAWLRSNVGYVQQEPQLFGLSIRENITYGVDREVSQEELEEVSRTANAHDFISDWPNGYETLVGERGIQLSGGQKQRIAIARALLVNPRILLLDEATSALDAESEHLVQEAIDKAVVGRTVLIVAHRLSTIRRASQIVVLENQQIVDVGTHDALLDRCTKYQDLIKRQSVVSGPINAKDLAVLNKKS